MPDYTTISLETDARGVVTLTLDRADKHNAMSADMIAELTAAAAEINQDQAVRVVVLTGAGKSFCAGGDLNWMREQFDADRATRMAEAKKLAMMLFALNTLEKPLIGKVNGNAFGGGVGMMAVCDIVVAADHAKFGLTETKLGLIPATISPYVLARMGEGNARQVFFSATLFGPDRAQQLGLVAKSVPFELLDEAVEAEIKPYFATSPQAVTAAKKLARQLGPRLDEALIDDTIRQLADTWETPDAQEGIGAFFDKRKANWVK
jgi:methylglutaconyl-CoA hydratase